MPQCSSKEVKKRSPKRPIKNSNLLTTDWGKMNSLIILNFIFQKMQINENYKFLKSKKGHLNLMLNFNLN